MSAYLVEDETIDLMINYAIDNNLIKEEDVELFGQCLLQENQTSVNYRYNELTECPKYTFTRLENVDILDVKQAVDCWDYQSCEHPTYKESIAYKFVKVLRKFYNAAFEFRETVSNSFLN